MFHKPRRSQCLGMLPKLIADIRQVIDKVPGASEQWLNHAINCIIHIERRNRVRTRDWLNEYGETRRSASSEATQSTASSIKRKRSSTPMREQHEDNNETRSKMQAFSIDPLATIIIETILRMFGMSLSVQLTFRLPITTRIIVNKC